MTSGGYRQPSSHKAVVSGPGRYSKRTDGQTLAQLPNAKYGEQQQYQALQHAGPMSATAPVQAPSGASAPPAAPTPLLAATARPWEDVTAGAPPAGAPAIPVQPAQQSLSDLLSQFIGNDVTGDLQALYQNALQKGL